MGEIVGLHHGVVEDVRNKVAWLEATLASEQQDHKDTEMMLHAERDNSQALRKKVAEQAAVIEKLRKGLLGCRKLNSLDNVGWSIDVSDAIDELLAIPTDSKQILADWMREQLGEPTTMVTRYDGIGWQEVYLDQPLYKLPDILK